MKNSPVCVLINSVFVISFFCWINIINAATITSAGNGDITVGGTWVGGVPPSSTDDAIVNSNHTVNVTGNVTVGSITVYSANDGDLTVLDIAPGAVLTVNGNVFIHSDGGDVLDEPYSQIRLRGTLVVKGNLIFQTLLSTDPALATLRMTTAGGFLELHQATIFNGEGGIIDARDNRATTVKFAGTVAQAITINSDVEYYNIILANSSSGGVSLAGNITSGNVYGNVTIESGKFQNSGYSISGIGGYAFTVKTGTNFILSGTSSMPTNFNHVLETGSTIEYAGTGQSISAPNNSQTYHHITIGGSGVKTLAAALTLNGNLTLNSGTLDVSTSNYGIDIKGNWINAGGTFQGRSGTFTMSGVAPSLTGTTTITSVLAISTGTTLTTNGNLVIESGASLMHGTGTTGGGGSISGNVMVKRMGNSNPASFNFWSAPISNASVSTAGSAGFYYDPSNAIDMSESGLRSGWVVASGTMTPGLGYAGKVGGTASFNGTVNNAPTGTPITVNVKKNVGSSNGVPYNLVGNPFPSAMSGSSFMAVNGPLGNNIITGALYFWDDDGSSGGGYSYSDYAVWTGAGGVTGPNNGVNFNGEIASGQSFFVEKISNGTSQLEFRNTMRTTANNAFFRTKPIQRLWVSLTNASSYNETLIAFIDDATDSLDLLYDAKKMRGNPVLSLFTINSDDAFAIQALAPIDIDKTVFLGIDATSSGTYTLHLKEIENMDETISVILEDTETSTFQNLRLNPYYTFNLISGSNIQRFKLHFNPAINVTITDASCDGGDGNINISQTGNYHWSYNIINEKGNLIGSGTAFNGALNFGGLSGGDYSLVLADDFGYQVSKTIHVGALTSVVARFEVNPVAPVSSLPVDFINLSEGAVNYHWEMGDGTVISGIENPVHVYDHPGTYEILLRASNADCSDELKQQINIAAFTTGIVSVEKFAPNIYAVDNNIFVDFTANQGTAAKILIYNTAGQIIHSKEISASGSQSINLFHVPSGFYLVEVRIGASRYEKKVFLAN